MPPPAHDLERAWLQQAHHHQRALAAATQQTAALLAALHYSRCLAWRCGLAPWHALLARARQQAAAADALADRLLLQRALEAWRSRRVAAQWLGVARDACAAAAARRCHQRSLQRRALKALQQHAAWARSLARLPAHRAAAGALCGWRLVAAAALAQAQCQEAAADAHRSDTLCRQALGAWQAGATRQRRERLAAKRVDDKWQSVQAMLVDARKQRQAREAAGGGATSGWSSGENSFDPNSLLF